MRSLVLLFVLTRAAHADFATCADTELAAAPRTAWKTSADRLLHRKPRPAFDPDAAEARALADSDPVSSLNILAADPDLAPERLAHLAEIAEKQAAPANDHDRLRHEAELAQLQARAGHAKAASAHLATAEAIATRTPDDMSYVVRDLWTTALVMHDARASERWEKVYFESVHSAQQFGVDARLMAYAGVGPAILPRASKDPYVLHMMVEGLLKHRDLDTIAKILPKLDVRDRAGDLRAVWRTVKSPEVAAMTRAVLATDVSGQGDVVIGDLVEVAAGEGFTAEATALVPKIQNVWDRAEHEADIAVALVRTDKAAAIAMARTALGHARTRGMRTDVINDKSAADDATWSATLALARAGALDEAKRTGTKVSPVDAVIGLRDNPTKLAAWWKAAAHDEKALVLASAAAHDAELGDPAFLAPFCP